MPQDIALERWRPAWMDVLAFALGLAVAWVSGWTTKDLVWSLWLSSLVVGFALVVWSMVRPVLEVVVLSLRDTERVREAWANNVALNTLVVGSILFSGACVLAAFTIHFGGFHFISASFLLDFFPIDGVRAPGLSLHSDLVVFREVMSRYWGALPGAFLAHRASFLRRAFTAPSTSPDVSVTADAIAARKAKSINVAGGMFGPYDNVFRMHAVIILLGGVHAARLDHFGVYAAVYALYFFPWRMLASRTKRPAERAAQTFAG
jgi:hypothetical protein